MRNCTWHLAGVGFVFALGACGASMSAESEAPPITESSAAPLADEPRISRPGDAAAPLSVADQPGETVEHPTEFSAAVFAPIECIDLDAIRAELALAAPHDEGGVTFVAVDAAVVDLGSLEQLPEQSAAADFDAWDRVEAPDRPELDGFDVAPAPVPDA